MSASKMAHAGREREREKENTPVKQHQDKLEQLKLSQTDLST
jgi:hypothetical protein